MPIFNMMGGSGLLHVADGSFDVNRGSSSQEYANFDITIPKAKSDDFIFVTKITQDSKGQIAKLWQSGNHLKGIIHYNRGSQSSLGEGKVYYSIYRGAIT